MNQSFRAEDTPPELIEQLRRPMSDLREEMRARARGILKCVETYQNVKLNHRKLRGPE